MYERFTDSAREVLKEAGLLARRLQCDSIGTEHLLRALCSQAADSENPLKHLFDRLAISPSAVVEAVECIDQRVVEQPIPSKREGQLGRTDRAGLVVEEAMNQARDFNHNYVSAEHMFLALLRVSDGFASQVLVGMGVTYTSACEQLLQQLVVDLGDDRPLMTFEAVCREIAAESEVEVDFEVLVGRLKTEQTLRGAFAAFLRDARAFV